MNMKEIGSEFWTEDITKSENKRNVIFDGKNRGFLCGRTALEYIIRDALVSEKFQSVLLPSYCCHTMIEPFVRNNIDVRFYSVIRTETGLQCILPERRVHEALYLMPYFGFGELDLYRCELAREWEFCILDETHSCMSGYQINYKDWNVRYTYASYRKWADIKGFAIARKIHSDFVLPYCEKKHIAYFKIKKEACEKKKNYIETGLEVKEEFLKLYAEAEEMLENDYKDYTALPEGILTYERMDTTAMIKKRRENGRYLIETIKNIKGISPMFEELKEKDCPLFIPIIVDDGKRDALRKYLIKNDIYCPVHWPISEYHKLKNEEAELYSKELSIICDQRYELTDMKRIIQVIHEFFDEKNK